MKDEIKEILDNLEDAGFMYKRISPEEIKKIKDYITNLQEENNKLRSKLIESIEITNKAIEIIDKELLGDDKGE